jgi:NAD+ synthase (glutamine-hydrolysing)
MLGVQIPTRTGRFDQQIEAVKKAIQIAKQEGENVIVFPSVFLTGFDLQYLKLTPIVHQFNSAFFEMLEISNSYEGYIQMGAYAPSSDGWKSMIYLIHQGKSLFTYEKNDIQKDIYYFLNNRTFLLENERIGILFFDELKKNLLPSDIEEAFDKFIVFAEEPYFHGAISYRKNIIEKHFSSGKQVIFVNPLALSSEKLYDGVFLLKEQKNFFFSKPFQESIFRLTPASLVNVEKDDKTQFLHDALVWGIREFFTLNNFEKAVLGLSGGIDSAVVAVLASEALGNKAVKALLLPSSYSSSFSITDAEALAKRLSLEYEIIPIKEVYETVLKTRQVNSMMPSLAEENLQARIRMLYIMYEANRDRRLMLNTSNKSEILTGYGTLYGDSSGAISVLGDVYKTEVYELARFINKNGEIIPDNIIKKEPSAELRPNQKDSDTLPPYHVLDPILMAIFEENASLDEISNQYPKEVLQKIVRLFYSSVFKGFQLPPKFSLHLSSIGSCKHLFYPRW